jgi:hypothetical protein
MPENKTKANNRTAVTFAITSSSAETTHALKASSSFVLERPLTLDSIRHTLKAAYGLIVRERRHLANLSNDHPGNVAYSQMRKTPS